MVQRRDRVLNLGATGGAAVAAGGSATVGVQRFRRPARSRRPASSFPRCARVVFSLVHAARFVRGTVASFAPRRATGRLATAATASRLAAGVKTMT
jgi:hypothetical protein